MSDTEHNAVPPPFDEVPSADSEPVTETQRRNSAPSGTWLRFSLIALFVGAIGFGQGLGLTLLFDREPSHLSELALAPAEKIAEGPAAGPVHQSPVHQSEEQMTAHVPVDQPQAQDEQQRAAPVREPHELEVARERFDMGDVEWARRTAAAFLLRLDGLGHEDTRRSSEAYAMLADVLRYEYERSLRDSRQDQTSEGEAREEH